MIQGGFLFLVGQRQGSILVVMRFAGSFTSQSCTMHGFDAPESSPLLTKTFTINALTPEFKLGRDPALKRHHEQRLTRFSQNPIPHLLAMNTHTEETTSRNVGYFTLLFGFAILTISFLSSCNTTRGLGRDVQKVGNTIERTAYKVQTSR